MKVRVTTAGLSILLGGCALPVPLQVATWAMEGVSVVTTKKTLTDHGMSAIAQKDCSLWRSLGDGDVCRDDDGVTAVAGLSTATDAAAIDAEPMMNNPDESKPTPAASVVSVELTPTFETLPADAVSHASPVTAAGPAAVGVASVAGASSTDKPGRNSLYYVVGSFSDRHNANVMAARHREFSAFVMSADVGGRKFYRVAVGPFAKDAVQPTRMRLTQAGISGAWLLPLAQDRVVADKAGASTNGKAVHGG